MFNYECIFLKPNLHTTPLPTGEGPGVGLCGGGTFFLISSYPDK